MKNIKESAKSLDVDVGHLFDFQMLLNKTHIFSSDKFIKHQVPWKNHWENYAEMYYLSWVS